MAQEMQTDFKAKNEERSQELNNLRQKLKEMENDSQSKNEQISVLKQKAQELETDFIQKEKQNLFLQNPNEFEASSPLRPSPKFKETSIKHSPDQVKKSGLEQQL